MFRYIPYIVYLFCYRFGFKINSIKPFTKLPVFTYFHIRFPLFKPLPEALTLSQPYLTSNKYEIHVKMYNKNRVIWYNRPSI